MNSALVRPAGNVATSSSVRERASFAAHLRTLERKVARRARNENFIDGKWIIPVKGGYFDKVSPCGSSILGWPPARDALIMPTLAVEAIAVAETMRPARYEIQCRYGVHP